MDQPLPEISALRFRNKVAAMVVRAIQRQEQGFLSDMGEAIAWKCAFIEAGCRYEVLCLEQLRDYEMMLYCVKGSLLKEKSHEEGVSVRAY